jgi:hypothetical protein
MDLFLPIIYGAYGEREEMISSLKMEIYRILSNSFSIHFNLKLMHPMILKMNP